jgi:hypothetical protein
VHIRDDAAPEVTIHNDLSVDRDDKPIGLLVEIVPGTYAMTDGDHRLIREDGKPVALTGLLEATLELVNRLGVAS